MSGERPAKRQRLDASSSESESDESLNENNLSDGGNDQINDDNASDSDSDLSSAGSNNNDDDSDDETPENLALNLVRLLAHAFAETYDDGEDENDEDVHYPVSKLLACDSDDEPDEDLDEDSESDKKESQNTPLIAAVKAEDIKLIKQLLRTGLDIDERGDDNKTALHVAVDKEYLTGIEILLEYGADISAKNSSDNGYDCWETPLHCAVKKNRLDIVQLLLTKQIDVRALTKNRETVLNHAIKRKNWRVIKCLSHSSSSSINNDNLFRETFKNFSAEQLKELGYGENEIGILFGRYADINLRNESRKTVLFSAVENRNLKMIKYLLEMGADINAGNRHQYFDGWTALHIAVDLNHDDVLQLLLNHEHCNVNAKTDIGETALHIAASKDNLPVVKKLLKKNAKLDLHTRHKFISGLTPYHVAVNENCEEVVKYFLDCLKIDVNTKTSQGENALQIAVRVKNIEMINLLLDRGIDINYHNKNQDPGCTALHLAVKINDNEIVDLLLNRGADVNVVSFEGKTILHEAINKKNDYIVRRLVDCGADVNKRSNSNRYQFMAPIHEATLHNLDDIIKLLIDKGADINALARSNYSFRKESIIDMAIGRACEDRVLQMLLDYGADINEAAVHRDLANSTSTILEQHILKLKVAKLFVHKKHLDWISRGIKKREFQSKCSKEIKKMKNEKISKTSVSYYDLLIKNVDQVMMYAENKNIERAVKNDQLKIKFPLYAQMIICHFKKGQKRNRLLKNAEKMLEDIFIDLPYNCVRKILINLSNDDLLVYFGKN